LLPNTSDLVGARFSDVEQPRFMKSRCIGIILLLNLAMSRNSELGKQGEDFACKYLVDKGFQIIDRNFRRQWGEIDIVARARDKTLVFVEVKTMKNFFSQGLRPEDQLTSAKLKKLQRIALLYANSHAELIDKRRGWRIDLIALTKIGADFLAKHYENI